MTPATANSFPHRWTARVLDKPPLIAPARQFTYPVRVPGEEEAMNRGALLVEVTPASGGTFLAICALGYRDPSLPSGIFSCPNPNDILFVAGGYAYLVPSLEPAHCLHLSLRPVSELVALQDQNLLLLGGINRIEALGPDGLAWKSERLSWEGITLHRIEGNTLHGIGWDMRNNRDVPFELDLQTGTHTGGGFSRH
ncbi:MAG TPA: hypothetical protein VGN16_05340 [Acidobacteriaceae bacterium]|jgi:hypothetical protein